MGAEIIESDLAIERRYDCSNYTTCFDVAAALNFDQFTCQGCDGKVDVALLWRAQHARRRDSLVRMLCHVPEPEIVSGVESDTGESATAEDGTVEPLLPRSERLPVSSRLRILK